MSYQPPLRDRWQILRDPTLRVVSPRSKTPSIDSLDTTLPC